MREVASAKVEGAALRGVAVIAYDLTSDAPPVGSFDLAVSLLVLHHVEDTRSVLGKVHALLATGGWMALADLDTEDGTFHDPDTRASITTASRGSMSPRSRAKQPSPR